MTFVPGVSGNPKGQRVGAKWSRKPERIRSIFKPGEEVQLYRKVIDQALAGDMLATKIVLDRTDPLPARATLIRLEDFPDVRSASDGPPAVSVILRGTSEGRLSLEQGTMMLSMVEMALRICNLDEVTKKLTVYELAADEHEQASKPFGENGSAPGKAMARTVGGADDAAPDERAGR